jgi:Flp pilus assembly protein TadD
VEPGADAAASEDRAGRLEDTPVPRLLLQLAAAGYTGTLSVARGKDKARIAWLRGMPVACDVEPPGPGLIELLAERGTIAAKDADRARTARAAKNLPEEAALLGLQLVTPKDLVMARRDVVARRLIALGRFETGDYTASSAEAPAAASEALRVDPLPIVQKLLAAHWRPDRLLGDLEAKLTRFPAPAESFPKLLPRLDRNPGIDEFGATLDGSRSAWAIVAGAADAARIGALWLLDVAGAIAWNETAAAPAPAASEPAGAASAGPEIEIEIVGVGAAQASAVSEARTARTEAAEDARAAELRIEIVDKREHLAHFTHYELLGIAQNASPGELKKAYLKAAKRFHPDALARLGLEELKKDANDIFAAITRANEVLVDPQRRRDYDAELAGEKHVDVERVAQAESLYRKADMMMRAGQFGPALEFVQGAVNLWPEDPAYQGALGWCLFRKNPPEEERARFHLEKSIELDDKDAVAHLRLGLVLKALGDAAGAARESSRGKALDPKAKP